MGEPDEEKVDIAIDGFFLAIGHTPNSKIFKPWIETDEVGYIKTVPGTPKTRVPGYLLPETWLIHIIAKPLRLQVVVVRLQSRRNAICRRLENNFIELILSL